MANGLVEGLFLLGLCAPPLAVVAAGALALLVGTPAPRQSEVRIHTTVWTH